MVPRNNEKELKITLVSQDELDDLVQLRLDFLEYIHGELEPEERGLARRQIKNYFERNHKEGQIRGYLGRMGEQIACGAQVLFYALPPMLKGKERLHAHLLSVFVYPQHRRRGTGSELMRFIIDDCLAQGAKKIVLSATGPGKKLYSALGFRVPEYDAMELPLS